MIKSKSGFEYEYYDDVLRVVVTGEIDHHSAAGLRSGIDGVIFEFRPKRLELDLSRVNFMDSSGLGLIMGRYSLMREQGGEVIVVDPAPMVEKVMNLAGMKRIIKVVKSEEADEDE